jgi:hypothetical protein
MNEVRRQEILAKTSPVVSPSYYCSGCWFNKAGVGCKSTGIKSGDNRPLADSGAKFFQSQTKNNHLDITCFVSVVLY